MKMRPWFIIGILIIGALSGPSALESGAAAQPAIEWSDIPFVLFGSAFGILFVVGMQFFRRSPKPSQWGLYVFGPISLWIVASGLSAVTLAILHGNVAPFAFFFLAAGIGAVLGVLACWLIFRWRYDNAR